MSTASPLHSWKLLLLAVLLSGCAGTPRQTALPPESAFSRPELTTLGRAFLPQQTARPGDSGYRLLNNGISALFARAALIDAAERSIDLQYYIYEADDVGQFLLDRLLRAAERGVHIRILLDDHDKGLDDTLLARLSSHRNIDVRLFNPFVSRAPLPRAFEMIFQLDRVGRRMHNKLLAVDGQAAVIGGRNIGNRYFEATADSNFRDIDLLAVGPVVKQALHNFDEYWNSPIVTPIEGFEITVDGATPDTHAASALEAEYEKRREEFRTRITSPSALIWAQGVALAEAAERESGGKHKGTAIGQALKAIRQHVKSELLIQTAYFVPGERGVDMFADLVKKGVKVRIMTNALAATDVVAVHAGYARYREALLAAGVALHEYRPDAPRPFPNRQHRRGEPSSSALHAKIMLFDRRWVWVGSANFDPRSRRTNTETGLLIDSPELAARIYQGIELDFSPKQSWRVERRGQDEAATLQWTGERDGELVTLESEPDVGAARALLFGLYSILPGIEELL